MLSIGMVMESNTPAGITLGKIEAIDMTSVVASALNVKEGNKEVEETTEELSANIEMETAPAAYIRIEKVFSEISTEEAIAALNDGSLRLEYSAVYSTNGLSKSRGAMFFNGHRETYYSEKVLPGTGLAIPGRHVADDGTIRDENGYICVAADPSYLARGSVLITSLGPAKVYDSGCAYGTVDIYVSW
jgi:hypothetical protein